MLMTKESIEPVPPYSFETVQSSSKCAYVQEFARVDLHRKPPLCWRRRVYFAVDDPRSRRTCHVIGDRIRASQGEHNLPGDSIRPIQYVSKSFSFARDRGETYANEGVSAQDHVWFT